ncbi:MAG: ATP-binding protein, partial [Oscillospiraceae bacterium]
MKKHNKISSAQELIAVNDIKNDLLYSDNGYIFAYIWVKTQDANLLSENEKEQFYRNIGMALEPEKQAYQLISLPRVVDTHDLIDNLLKLRRGTKNEAKLQLINNEIAALQEMARNGLKEPLIFLKLWQKQGKKAEAELKKRQSDFVIRLCSRKAVASICSSLDITYICKLFAELGQHHIMDDNLTNYTAIPKIKRGKKKESDVSTEIERIEKINMITPCGGLHFGTNSINIGSMSSKIYFASLFPASLEYAWAVPVMNCTEAVTCITYTTANSNSIADALSSSIKQSRTEAIQETDVRTQKAYIRQANDADKLIDQIVEKGDVIGQMSIAVMPFTDKEEELEEVCRRVQSIFSNNRIKLRLLGQLQKQGFLTISPYHVPDERILLMSQRIMPLNTLMGGSPMTINNLKDDNGFYFAVTADGSICSLDLSKRGGDRTNSNIVVTGKPGTGKSTAIKHIIQILWMAGWKVIIIDPEREYKDMCKRLDGAWLDAGGGAAKSNVLQIRSVPLDDDDEDEKLFDGGDYPLAQHIKTLETFLYTYLPNLTDIQKALLKQTIIELYALFNITWETDISSFKNDEFPIFSDLYKLLTEKSKKDKRYEDIACLFLDIAEGADSFLWNGYTNIDTDSDFVVFDTNKLSDASDKIVCTQYFNLLTQAWQMMAENREQPVALICDEAYLLVDPTVPQSLMYLRNISKRCRKYMGALAVISHSLIDFLDP